MSKFELEINEWSFSAIAHENDRLYKRLVECREALRLISQHPVPDSGQWEVGAKEMIALAKTVLDKTQ